jgi:peptidoglycan/LPS O-acetylase OafA/YrhL
MLLIHVPVSTRYREERARPYNSAMPSTQDAVDVTRSSVHLDAVRGIAAVVVVLGHTRDLFFSSLTAVTAKPGPVSSSQPTPVTAPSVSHQITIGNEAVMVFFVLSGYLVGGSVLKSLKKGRWSWKDYLVKRLTRLWVVLLPALLVGLLFDWSGMHLFPGANSIYAGPPGQAVVMDLLQHLSARVILGNAVFLQKVLVQTAGTNESLWSLANEFWYYIAFPVFLLALIGGQKAWKRVVYGVAFIGIGFLVGQDVSILFPIWMLGALLSLVPLRVPAGAAKLGSAILTVLLPIVFIGIRRAPISGLAAELLIAAYFTLLMYLLLHQTETARRGLYKTIAGFFSRISYTLYLFHLPLAVFLCALINNPWQKWPKTPVHVAEYLLLNVVVVTFAYLFYLLFESRTDGIRRALFAEPHRERHLPAAREAGEEVSTR